MPELVVQLSHAGYISAMALSADGRFLITAGWDRTVRLWHGTTGQEIRHFEGHGDVVNAVSFSRDGRAALTGSKDGTARLWDIRDGAEVLHLAGHSGGVTTVAFSPDDAIIVTGGSDRTLCLWRKSDGTHIRTIQGFAGEVSSVAFSHDGRHILVGSHLTAQLIDVDTGEEIRRFEGHTSGVSSVAVSPCGRFILTGSWDNSARIWDKETGTERGRLEGHSDGITAVSFSSDCSMALTASRDKTARLWDVTSRKEVRRFSGHGDTVSAASISSNGKHVYTASERIAYSWSAQNGNLTGSFKGNSALVSGVAFSPDGRFILIGSWDDSTRLLDAAGGIQIRQLQGHTDDVRAVAFSPDGRFLLTGSRDRTARLWNAVSGKELYRFKGHAEGVRPVSFSPDGRLVLTGSDDGMARIWEAVAPHAETGRLGPHPGRVVSAVFSPDGKSVLTASTMTLFLWNKESSQEIRNFKGHTDAVNSAVFSPDGRFALSSSWDRTARIWDVKNGDEILRLEGHGDGLYATVFSPDGRFIATGSQDNTARLWDAGSGRELRIFKGHRSRVVEVAFSPDGRFILTASEDQTARLWDVSTGEELCKIIIFRDGSWAIVDREGRFDASNGGDVQGLHWVIGTEAVALAQLKERYYEPGLLAKKLGFNKESLRDVQAFTAPELFPLIEAELSDTDAPSLKISLTNRGGGIGRVIVSINGKEVAADARGPAADTDAEELSLEVPVAGHPFLIPGEDNVIEVRALNAEGYLSSRGVSRVFRPSGQTQVKRPTLWAIVAGISDYQGDRIDLHYAAKDARDMARAISIGAHRLFGADRVKLTVLAAGHDEDALAPTKVNFRKAFAETEAAKPEDILIIYLAGHGIASGDDYYYLTGEARSADLTDPAIRGSAAISSEEMVTWLKQSPALKQVMVLDTCAAGGAAVKLVEKRDISSEQIRAIERLKDRTGFHVLMGSAADAVSYEATQYEQGLLTYALLQGMRGAALREGEFVDVSALFQHAANEVPALANHIGGIQRPRIAAPRGTSFDIGQLTEEDRKNIPLSLSKPMIVQPVLLNEMVLFDDLNLTGSVRRRFREASYAWTRGESVTLPAVYVTAQELSGAIRPSGTYRVEGARVTARVVLVRNGQILTDVVVQGSRQNLEDFAGEIVEAILHAVTETQ
jgi:WD40 repeat protein